LVASIFGVATRELSCNHSFITGPASAPVFHWESSLTALLRDLYPVTQSQVEHDLGYDLATADRRRVLHLKYSLQSVRDLGAILIRLASWLDGNTNLERATLVAYLPKMTSRRIHDEWVRGLGLFRPDIATRLGLVALTADGDFCSPDDAELRRLTVLSRAALREKSPHDGQRSAGPWSPKQFDVWMVLLEAWLRREAPLPIKDVLRRSGTSTATLKTTFDRLHARGEIERTSSRRASFAGFPRRSLGEMLPLFDGLRHTAWFVDASGRPPDLGGLLRRLASKAPPGVGLGGVEAARHYTPEFDLEGLPRVDISIHGQESLAWLRAVDPALRQARDGEAAPVLVVHRIIRAESGFARATVPASGRMQIAGRAETLLDLYELRLISQADAFVRVLRREAKS